MSREAAGPELRWVPAAALAGVQRLEIRIAERIVGDLDFQLCPACELAVLEQVRVDPAYRGRGLARGAVRAVLTRAPGYTWSMTTPDPAACGFWDAFGWPLGAGPARYCLHMLAATTQAP